MNEGDRGRRLQAAEKVRVDLETVQPERTLTGAVRGVTVEQVEELKAAASEIPDQFTYGSNRRGSAEYRHHLGRVLLRRCMEEIQKKEEQ